jgi:uncharacterized membrane protein YhaH (DUF805 family)
MKNFNLEKFTEDCITVTTYNIKRTFDFKGITKRKEYWQYQLTLFVILLIALTLDLALGSTQIIFLLTVLGASITSVSAGIRRVRDTGFNPWLFAIVLIPYIGILGFIFLLLPSEPPEDKEEELYAV